MKLFFLITVFCIQSLVFVEAQSVDLPTPTGSGHFGTHIATLPNGNYVVTDPYYDDGPKADVGAFYLFNGITHSLISSVKGARANDMVGNGGVALLKNGNFLVSSSKWNDNAGAVTWGSQVTGVNGIVSSDNSLVGSPSSTEARHKITVFDDGNFVVSDTTWNRSRGAVTWGSGISGIVGTISSSNSFTGNEESDKVGRSIVKLANNKFVIVSDNWNYTRGAVTFLETGKGLTGELDISNSLVGSNIGDELGSSGLTTLPSGNFLILSPLWGGLGAVTFVQENAGITGEISESNSLTGSYKGDSVGKYAPIILPNGNYLLRVPTWNSGTGAVVWGSGISGINGKVSFSNALTGSGNGEKMGAIEPTVLTNGNYVVTCNRCDWGNGSATWGNGLTGITGVASETNSLSGGNKDSAISVLYTTALTNGNYVVQNFRWNGGLGAITWADGSKGLTGSISFENSLIGERVADNVGYSSVHALKSGNYLLKCGSWNENRGAITWANGLTGITGYISAANSLVGSDRFDLISSSGLLELVNGNYIVCSPYWGGRKGAITWGSGITGVTGPISASNSLIGSGALFGVASMNPGALNNGNYIVVDPDGAQGRGVIVWGDGNSGSKGVLSNANILTGSSPDDHIGSGFISSTRFHGKYLVTTPTWNQDRGASTFIDGSKPVSGVISAENSLVGTAPGDRVGSGTLFLPNGNYLSQSRNQSVFVGALTWGDSLTGVAGEISINNSLVSRNTNEKLGALFKTGYGIQTTVDGNYLLISADMGLNTETVTFVDGSAEITGNIPSCNSITTTANSTGPNIVASYNSALQYVVVGRPNENMVSILYPYALSLPPFSVQTSQRIGGTGKVRFLSKENCSVIATISPSGTKPFFTTVAARVWLENAPITQNNKPYVQRHYEISPSETKYFPSSNVTLYFSQPEFDAFNAHRLSLIDLPKSKDDVSGKGNLRIFAFPGRSNDDTGSPASYSGSPVTIYVEPQNIIWNSRSDYWEVSFDSQGYQGFFLGSTDAALPVKLTKFTGVLQEQNALLLWETTDEDNVENFVLERSISAVHFEEVSIIKASNVPGMHQYSYLDATISGLIADNVYYRLKMIDRDGSFTYSKVVAIHQERIESVFPNPVIDKAYINLKSIDNEAADVRLFDLNGQEVLRKNASLRSGQNRIEIDMKTLSSGMYIISIEGSTVQIVRKVTKQ